MKREQFVTYCFIVLLIWVVIEVLRIFSPFFNAILWAVIFAFGFYPLHLKFKKNLRLPDTVSSLLMTLFIFILVVPPVVMVLINITTQAIEIYQLATQYVREGHLENLIEKIRALAVVQKIETNVLEWEPLKEKITEWLLTFSRGIANFSVNQVGIITKNLLFVVLNTILAFVLVFIFLKDGQNIYEFIYHIVPLEESNKKSIFRQINGTFGAVIRGQILTSLVQSLVAGITFSALGIPAPIILGMATFLTSLVPVLGAQAIWLPLVIYLVIAHETVKAVILGVLGVGVISLMDNIMKPALIGERTKLPYFLLFFGILGGMKVYGLMGIFIAPVILSLFFAVVKIYQEKFA